MNYGFYNYGMPPFGVAPSWDTGFQLPEMPMQPYGPLQSIPQFDTYTFTGGMPIGAQPINTGMFMPTGNTGMSLDMNMLGGWFAFFQNLNMQLQSAMQPPQIQNTPLGNDFYGGGNTTVFVNGDRVNGKTNLFGEPIDDSGSTKAPSKEEEEEFRSQFEGRSATDIKKIDEERFNELEPWQKKIVAEEYAIAYTEEKTGKKNLKFEDLTQEQIDAAMWSAKKDSGGPPTSSTLVDTALSKKVGELKASESAEATTADELNAQLAEGKVKITEDNIDLVDFDKILSMKDKDKALKIIKNMDLSGLKQNQKDLLAVKFAGAMDNDKAEALGINRDGHDFNDRVSKGDLDKLASILSGMGQPGLGDSLTKIGKNIEEFCKGADQHSWNGGFFWKDNFMEKKAFNSVMLHNRLAGGKTIEELIEDGK